jgi:hypothetical protein
MRAAERTQPHQVQVAKRHAYVERRAIVAIDLRCHSFATERPMLQCSRRLKPRSIAGHMIRKSEDTA